MSQKKPTPRKRDYAKERRDRKARRDKIAAAAPTLEQIQAENAKLRERNEQLEETNDRLSKKVLKKAVVTTEEEAQQTADASKFAETIGTESREDLLKRLGTQIENLESELRERRAEDRANAAHAQAFELIKLLATHRTRLGGIEIKPSDRLINRSLAYEATLEVTYSAGTHRFTAVAADPARALLEALAQFADQSQVRKVPPVQDLGTLFALIDNQWVLTKGSAYLPTHAFALAK